MILPALLPEIFGGQIRSAATTIGVNLLILAVIYAVFVYGLLAILRWVISRLANQLRSSLGLLAKAIPLLAIFALLSFTGQEMWQIFSSMSLFAYFCTIGLFVVLGSAFLFVRVPRETRRLEHEVGEGPPLTRAQRFNVGLVLFVSQALQVLFVSLAIGAFFVAFGMLAITDEVRESWIGDAGTDSGDDLAGWHRLRPHGGTPAGRRWPRRLLGLLLRGRDADRLDLSRGVPRGADVGDGRQLQGASGLSQAQKRDMTSTIIPNFRHVPGNHCGSTALRNLLGHAGIELTEEMVFGLGAGACFYYVSVDGQKPSRFFNGRTAALERQFCELTGLPLGLETFADADASWLAARAAVDEGRPPLLITDLYYLDHYGNSAHFPGHAVVLAGYDDEVAYLSDTSFDELQTTRLENLARARHGRHPIFPLDGHMLAIPADAALFDPRTAAPEAIARAVQQMRDPSMPPFDGMAALHHFAEEVGHWPEQVEDWQWCARFGYQVIERRGTGGGNFRLMYSRFLVEAGFDAAAAIAGEAARRWTDLASALQRASEGDGPDPAAWARVDELAQRVLEAEERLWLDLAE